MAEKKSGKGGRKRFGLKRKLIVAGLVFSIFYIGVQVISRTDGVRSLVADKISNGTRLPVTLEHCAATPLLGFRLKGLELQGMELPDVKLSFNWFCRLSKDQPFVKELFLKDAEFRFRRVPATGNWEPLAMSGVARRVGEVVGVNPPAMKTDDSRPVFPAYAINPKTLLQLKQTKVMWLDDQGNELASIEKGDMRIKMARLVERKVVQTIVQCGQVTLGSRRVLDDFRLETVHVDGSDWVTVLEMSDSGSEYPPFSTSTLWQDLNQQLNRLSAVE